MYDSNIYAVFHVQIFLVKSVINPVMRICRSDLHLGPRAPGGEGCVGGGEGVGKYRGVMW